MRAHWIPNTPRGCGTEAGHDRSERSCRVAIRGLADSVPVIAIPGHPRAPKTEQHDRVQDATEGLDRDQVGTSQPGDPQHVDAPVETVSIRGSGERHAEIPLYGRVANLAQLFILKPVQQSEVAIGCTGDNLRLSPILLGQAW